MQHRDEPSYPPRVEQEIAAAYANASKYDPTNPLFKGRELGFLARLNHSVKDDFQHWMHKFRRSSGSKGVVIFAQRVLAGMSWTTRQELAKEPWAAELLRHAELRSFFP